MSHRPEEDVERTWMNCIDSLDRLMKAAETKLPADRLRVLRSSAEKLQSTVERTSYHIALFLDQFVRLSSPSGPRGPATVHRLRPGRRRRR